MKLFITGPGPASWRSLPAPTAVLLAALAASAAGYTALLWPEWRQNPDLSHGFFAPLVFVFLIWESRRSGPERWLTVGAAPRVLLGTMMLLSVAWLGLAGLFSASLGWDHALVLFLTGAALAAFLTGGLLILADERVRLVPFNWISLTAIFLWILVSPVPDGSYARLTLGLQNWVTGGVMTFLQFFGVPARQFGNVIELARTTVGVAEACSGVRSLISCVYAGFFFAAWQVRRPARRAVLIVIAPLLALGMNFIRSLTLTLLANGGVEIEGAWHDGTGFAILAVTAAILAGTAMWLESEREPQTPAAPISPASAPPVAASTIFGAGTALLLALGWFFVASSRPATVAHQAPPPLASLVPPEIAGWQVSTVNDLEKFSGILQTTDLLERTYVRTDRPDGPVSVNVYIAYWPPGRTSVSRVASHTPDACWPGSGWIAQTDRTRHAEAPLLPGVTVSPAEYRFFSTARGQTQHVWFWHVFDGRVITYRDPYSIPALLQIGLQYGFRRQGSQYFVRLSSNRPWNEIAAEPLVREIITNLTHVGL